MRNLIACLLSLGITGIIYLLTMAPGVVEIDSGELAAIQYTAGIAHPTGYPLFTWLGWLFTRLPLASSMIYQINFLALLYVLISLGILWVGFQLFLEKIGKVNDQWTLLLLPSAGVITLGFSKTYWAQATATEVYSLHLVMLASIIVCLIYIQVKAKPSYWYLLAILLGLGFSNHMTTLMILPGIAWLYFRSYGLTQPIVWKRLAGMIGIFAGILIINYGAIMIRAASEPVLNWGNPHSWERLMVHVSGWQYRVWLFSSSKVTKANLAEFFSNFSLEFSFISLILILPGLIYLIRKNKLWATFFVVSFAFTVLYASNYDIADLDAYFLLAYISAAFLLLNGWIWFMNWKPNYAKFILGISFLPGIWQVSQLYSKQDRSQEFVFEDYTRDAMNSLPENALLMSYQWDFLVSPTYYFQQVEGFRKDICVVDKELLRRSWYYPQMERQYSKVFKRVESESTEFIQAVTPMELGNKNFDAKRLEFLFRKIIQKLITPGQYEAYLGIEMMQNDLRNNQIDLPEGYTFIPDKYFMRIVPDSVGYQPLPFTPYQIRFGNPGNSYGQEIRKIAASMAVYRALYEKAAGYPDKAEVWKQEALRIKPDFQLPTDLVQ